VPFKSRNNIKYKTPANDKYSYINRNAAATSVAPSTTNPTPANNNSPLTDQQTASQIAFLNRNKNPAFAGKETYYQSRFNFYNNTHLLNNTSAINSRASSSNQNSASIPAVSANGPASTSPTGTNGPVNKSAILSHLNLNVKAREELEKRKQAAKQQQQKGEVALENSSPSKLNGDSTPAIPITSYSSFNNEDDDEDSDSESDEEKEKEDKIKFDLKKRKLDVIKINAEDNAKTTSNKKKKSEEVNAVSKAVLMEEEDEDEEGSSYFNVFKAEAGSKVAKQSPAVRTLTSKQLATLKTNVKKQPILKQPILKQQPVLTKQTVARQPIIKSGQTPKDREEVTLSFIGKYLKLKQIDRCLITVPFFLKKTRNGAQYRELNILRINYYF